MASLNICFLPLYFLIKLSYPLQAGLPLMARHSTLCNVFTNSSNLSNVSLATVRFPLSNENSPKLYALDA